jgi:3-ketosteroid 9alpha-monooxygenase subunit B
MATESYVLTVAEVVEETQDARSVVFEVPDELRETFAYTPGQFLTLGVPSEETGLVARCYSLSSTPHSGRHQVTVKRTEGGYASNWINDHLKAGDTLRVLPPSGIFTPKDLDADLLLFAGGSGITPVRSIAETALDKGAGRVVLFYANRDERSVIFAEALRELAAQHADRFVVVHWLESVQGLPSQDQLRTFAAQYADFTAFVCGPAPFMKAVVEALKELEFPRARRHQEKFVSLGGNPFGDVEEVLAAQATLSEADDGDEDGDDGPEPTVADTDAGPAVSGPIAVEVELDGETHTFDDWQGDQVLLEFLEEKGLDAPFSCREGQCSACACMVLEGDVVLKHNEVLDEADLADGIRLACQSLPASEKLRITYNG